MLLRAWFACFLSVVCSGLFQPFVTTALAAPPVHFNRDIRPLLSDNCFQCHGPDEQQRKGGLRLDGLDWSTAIGDSKSLAVTPGKSAQSELWVRLSSTDPNEQMPPPTSGKQLSESQKDLIQRWINEGAKTVGHWGFERPVRHPIPTVDSSLPIHPIDAFIDARLREAGLKPNPEADKSTLIRRVTLDLTGLPPTPAEVDAFLNDNSPAAYERVVDRLLISPRFGEHMAQAWLDFARFADSNGFQIDSSRQMWPWRDWVINAYNQNLPFDQFTVEQIAGDLLPNATRSQRVATGFNRNHRLNGEGGLIAEEWRVETVIDRVEATGLTWLGLTFNCCRCHDHKYDPISQREFYQMFAFFNNVPESGTLQGESRNTDPVLPVPTPLQEKELDGFDQQIRVVEAEAAELAKNQLDRLLAEWEPGFRKQLQENPAPWRLLELQNVKSVGGATLTRQGDGSWLASGNNPGAETYESTTALKIPVISGLLLEALPDPSLPAESVGRYPNGNFVLTRVEALLTSPKLAEPVPLQFAKVSADYSQSGWDIQNVLKGDKSKGWAVDGPTRKEVRKAMFVLSTPVTVPDEAVLQVKIVQESLDRHNIGRFRLSVTSLPSAMITLDGVKIPEAVRLAVETPIEKRNVEQKTELASYFRATADSPIRRADLQVAELKRKQQELPKAFPNVMVMIEGQPRETRTLIRGQYDRPGDVVTAGVPSVLPPLPTDIPRNRLALARWMVSNENPLTARVWVNRAWERFFGIGLVKTSENLGSQSEFPSHPELLDWLACEFMQPTALPDIQGKRPHAWDMKAFCKMLVTSAAYRRSAAVSATQLEKDPDNRLLSRGPRFRLSAEAIRDQALSVSGLLVEKVGGPSVRPYMPDGVWDETSRYGDLLNYKHDQGEGLYRRTLYTIWKRTAAPPSMLLFDAPNREVCTPKRSRTNTPLQALALLNEVTYVEAARKLAERILREGGATTRDRTSFAFRLVTARKPTSAELEILLEGFQQDSVRFQKNPDSAKQLLGTGTASLAADLDPIELASWTVTANVLLNLDEVTTRE